MCLLAASCLNYSLEKFLGTQGGIEGALAVTHRSCNRVLRKGLEELPSSFHLLQDREQRGLAGRYYKIKWWWGAGSLDKPLKVGELTPLAFHGGPCPLLSLPGPPSEANLLPCPSACLRPVWGAIPLNTDVKGVFLEKELPDP